MPATLMGGDVTLALESGDGMVLVHVDLDQVEQVVLNMAANARGAMRASGTFAIRVEGSDTGPPGHPSAAGWAIIRLIDDGEVIEPAVAERIFEPFHTTKNVDEGIGLGLATCLGITQQSGGTIEVDSSPTNGTTFSFWLPAVAVTTAVAPHHRHREHRIRAVHDSRHRG